MSFILKTEENINQNQRRAGEPGGLVNLRSLIQIVQYSNLRIKFFSKWQENQKTILPRINTELH